MKQKIKFINTHLKSAIKSLKHLSLSTAAEELETARIILSTMGELRKTVAIKPEPGKCYLCDNGSGIIEFRVLSIEGNYMFIEGRDSLGNIAKAWACINNYKFVQTVPMVGWDSVK